jgi:hypothetical protein
MVKKAALSEKHKLFVEAYLVCHSPQEAAKQAGYNCKKDHGYAKIGYEILNKPLVQEFLKKRQEEIQKLTNVNVEYITNGIVDVINKSKEVAQYNTTLKGYELLGKHLGYFEKDNKKVFVHDLQSLTDIELNKLIQNG